MHPRTIKSHQHLSFAAAKLRAAKLRRECDDYNWTVMERLLEPTIEIYYDQEGKAFLDARCISPAGKGNRGPTKMDLLRTALVRKNFLDQYNRYN